MQSFEAVYARMLFAAGVRTQTELADILGIRQASISDAKKRKSIPSQWCMRLYDARAVRVDWQRQGIGPVYDERKLAELEKARDYRWDWQDTLPDGVLREPESVPLELGIEGERPVYGTLMTSEGAFPEVGRQVFPKEFLKTEARIFRIQDAKMAPVLNRGALAAVECGTCAADGEIAAVLLGRELVFRRVSAVEGGYELHAEGAEDLCFILAAEWSRCCYGKALWAFQPLS